MSKTVLCIGKKRISIEEAINLLSAILIVIITVSPPLRIGMAYYMSITLCCFFWLLTAFLLNKKYFLVLSKPVSIAILTPAAMSGILLIFGNIQYWKMEVGLFLYFFIVILFCYYRRYNPNFLFTLMWIALAVIPVWCVITIGALLKDPYVSRSIVEGSDNILSRKGIGGYGFTYMCSIISPCCCIVFFKAKINLRIKRVLILINAILCTILVALAGFTIGVSSIVMLFGFYFLFSKNKKGRFRIGAIALCITAGIAAFLSMYPILDYLMIETKGTSHYAKIRDIYYFLNNGVVGGTISARIDVYLVSIKTFSKNILMGLFSNTNVKLDWTVFGGHSAILDGFSLYGIIIGAFILYLFLVIPIQLFKDKRYKTTSLPLAALLTMIFVLLFNNVTDLYAIAATIVLYCSVELVCGEKKVNEQKN
jgi:hypothetical protein